MARLVVLRTGCAVPFQKIVNAASIPHGFLRRQGWEEK